MSVLLLGGLMLLQTPASGRISYRSRSDRRARMLYLAGDRYYSSGEYERALATFEQAYRLSKRSLLLYNMANACERMGRLADAITYLERYAAKLEDDSDEVAAVLRRVHALRARLPAGQGPASMPLRFEPLGGQAEKDPTQQADEEPAARAAPRVSDRSKEDVAHALVALSASQPDSRRGRRIAGYTLLGVGAASLATGVVFGVLALDSRREAEDHCLDGVCSVEAREPQERLQTRALVADVAFGAAAVSAAIGTYLVVTGRSPGRERPTVAAGLSAGGVQVAVTQRF